MLPVEKGISFSFCSPLHVPPLSKNRSGLNLVGSGKISGSVITESNTKNMNDPLGRWYPL